jgi:hypothetical protein
LFLVYTICASTAAVLLHSPRREQEECVSELGRIEDHRFGQLDAMAKYFQTRAKIVSKVCVYAACVLLYILFYFLKL